MTDAVERALSDWFAELVALDAQARAAQLASLPEALAGQLRALLDADAGTDDAIAAAISRDAQSEALPDYRGQRIGAWRVVRELGSGGMGTVLLVEREQGGFMQQAALKLIRGFPSQDGMRRLRHERQILATLDHPDIARLIDGGETDDGQPYLVVEWVRGQTLDAHVRATSPGHDARIELIERIGAAVQHAHQQLVIHRDLKPGNVMITPSGEIKLLDFGVAKLLDVGDHADGSTRVYTPGYASPEQTRGERVGIATDVYSLGCMLRELLIGALATAGSRIDAELSGIIAKATAEHAHDRYITVAAFCDDLARYRRGLPVNAAADTFWYRARKFVNRHRLAVAASVAAMVLVAILVLRLSVALEVAQEQRLRAEQQTIAAEQHLARSRAVVLFFADMFEGVAPEHALGRALLPSELLLRAERQLREHPPQDPSLRADLAAEIGSLYQRLGDGEAAVRLLESSIADQVATDRAAAIELAMRHDRLAIALFDLDRRAEALAQTEAAVALRDRFAADDAALAAQSQLELARAYIGVERNDDARAALAEADRALTRAGDPPLQRIDHAQITAILAADEARFADARDAALAGLAALDAHPEIDQTRRIEFERTVARAAQGLGQLDAAAAAFARAIDAQTRWIGDHGTRAMGLHNDHAILLATLGRFDDALVAYDHAAQIFAAAGGPAPERNPRHLNNSCDAQLGRGDYAKALQLCRAAADILFAERPPADPERLAVESNLARATAMAGDPASALVQFASVRARAIESAGPESFPVALHAFRATRAALLAGRDDEARALAEDAIRIFSALFVAPHPWRARALRIRALVHLATRGETAADLDLAAARTEAAATLPATHPLLAQIDLDLAVLRHRAGDDAAARALLLTALPNLRRCCIASEVDRQAAEALAVQVGGAEGK